MYTSETYLSVVSHVDDSDGDNFASREFARVPSSGGSLYYTNGESSDTVWPSMYIVMCSVQYVYLKSLVNAYIYT